MNQHVGPTQEPAKKNTIETSAQPGAESPPSNDADPHDREEVDTSTPSKRVVVTRGEIERAGGHIKLALREGFDVVTYDGKELGQVSALSGAQFKVDAPMAPDFWLPLDSVSSTVGGIVTLRFSEIDLADYKKERPEGA